jgi:hypothetical protein
MALGEQPVDDVGAEEPGAADDQRPHTGMGRRALESRSPASTTAPRPSTTSSRTAPAPTRDPGPRMESVTVAPSPTVAAGQQHAAADLGARLHDDPHTEHTGIDVTVHPRIRRQGCLVHGPPAVDGVQVGLAVQLGAAGVDPVVLGAPREQPALRGHGREDDALHGHPGVDGNALEHRRLDDVGAGIDHPARRRLP